MRDYHEPLLLDEERAERRGAYISSLRFALRVINLVLALVGVAMVLFAVRMYASISKEEGIHGFPWFIFAFAAAGALVLLTAGSALVGVAHDSRCCLSAYSLLTVALLLGQAALIVAFFADRSWQRLLPHDDTGEAAKLYRFLKRKLDVARWVGLAALLVQVLGVAIASALSGAQLRLIDECSYEEDAVWGRREAPAPPPAAGGSGGSGALRSPGPAGARRSDPWSQRMRSKYGLDVDDFSYDPGRQRRPGGQ